MIDDDDEIHPRLSNGGQTHFDMDEAFCARMRKAIEAGLEKAPIGAGNQEAQIPPSRARAASVPAGRYRRPATRRAVRR